MTKKKYIYKKKGKVIKDLSKKIIQLLLKNNKQSFNYKQLASRLSITSSAGKNQLLKKIIDLKEQKKIQEESKGKYKIATKQDYFIGKLDVTSNGNAYLISDQLEKDIFIPSINLNRGLDQDIVKIYVYKRRRSSHTEGEVIEIIKRAKTTFVGVLQMNKNFGFVIPDQPKMYADIFIPAKKINGAKDGDKVVAEISDWPENSKNPFGKIIQVLGKPGEHETEIHSILLEYGLPYKFEEEVENYANKIPEEITKTEINKRRDLRHVTTFTIDPKDAKDFDDALSFQQLKNGNIEVGIHIADVSHYVQPNSVLDQEAYQRATSVYLVDRVVPMLPEILSNKVCSLRPNEEKLTFSAIFELNENGDILNEWFGRTVIYSDKRFTYDEAQEIIEGKESNYTKELITLNNLAHKLRNNRLKNGAITFDKVEVKFKLDAVANPIGIYFKEAKDANKLIEEFMLLANKKVAQYIGKKKDGAPTLNTFIYRVHDDPNPEKLAALSDIIGKFGYKIITNTRKNTSQSLNKLLKEVQGKAEENLIETLTIRSMSKAVYTTENIGHYGLAFDYYTHFTSPIRRYPDILSHRLLQHYLNGGKSPNADIYEEMCKHSSEQEQMAAKAERESIKYMQIKYIQNFTNIDFKGVITGVTEWGIYVEIIENKCEGMVRIKDIKDDYYTFDEKEYSLIGAATKKKYQLGDEVLVSVKNTDLERKFIDFNLLT